MGLNQLGLGLLDEVGPCLKFGASGSRQKEISVESVKDLRLLVAYLVNKHVAEEADFESVEAL